jgi:hypothetical protein
MTLWLVSAGYEQGSVTALSVISRCSHIVCGELLSAFHLPAGCWVPALIGSRESLSLMIRDPLTHFLQQRPVLLAALLASASHCAQECTK